MCTFSPHIWIVGSIKNLISETNFYAKSEYVFIIISVISLNEN